MYLPYFFKTIKLKRIEKSNIPDEGNWANLSDGNIYYRWFLPKEELSNGETLVLVHGFSTPSFVWGGLIDNFCNSGFKVLVYDHFGRGFSERPRINYDKELYVRSLKELLVDQGLEEKIHLVGYSMGGPIVGYFAEQYPNTTKSISLIAPAGFQHAMSGVNSWTIKPILGEWFWHVFNSRIYGVGKMSETVNSNDPLSINEEEFLENFNKQILKKFPKVSFWIDSGLNKIKLDKNYNNYVPVFCSEKAKDFELSSEKFKKHICSIDYKNGIIGPNSFHRCIRTHP